MKKIICYNYNIIKKTEKKDVISCLIESIRNIDFNKIDIEEIISKTEVHINKPKSIVLREILPKE